MLTANLRLSSEERQLLLDERFILTKRSILQKTEAFFGELSELFRQQVVERKMEGEAFLQWTPKIARGENYHGLPWIMMDYPRLFGKKDVCAIRCFFWWGQYCSITLHVSGIYQERFQYAIIDFLRKEKGSGWLYATGDDPWQHIIDEDHYQLCENPDRLLAEQASRSFLKIAKKIPLEKWDELDDFYTDNFVGLLSVLGH
ncbi:hypothetical protein KACHI17_13510 [Sediminibacterium sp. KACHI17]|jgi:hypothetical protein|uniref:DUF3841 domain-containing protein n=1 Tax=Sediminibacterium sp. KACHI17 TaxID=1751071 RepID=A0AAT9GIY7_9BACT